MAIDPQVIQQLTQVFQQGLTILQAAGGAATDPTADPMADPMGGGMPAMGDASADDGTDDMDMMGGDDMGMGGDDMGMGGDDGNLHDRVSQLEDHTGLKKSASAPIVVRLDNLEEHWLGETYEGSAVQRVAQLENVAGLRKAANQTRRTKQTRTPANQTRQDDAPDVIPLDSLIKAAITEGIAQVMKQQAPAAEDDELPSVESLRKSGRRNQPVVTQRRGVPHAIQSDAALTKAAQAFGYSDEDDLDQPAGLGDYLLMQYHASRSGSPVFTGDDD
jgi:hypothetical protein